MVDGLHPMQFADYRLSLDERGSLHSIETQGLDHDIYATGKNNASFFSWDLWLSDTTIPSPNWDLLSIEISDTKQRYRGICAEVVIDIVVSSEGLGPHWEVKLNNQGHLPVSTFDFVLNRPFTSFVDSHCTFPYCAGWTIPIISLKDGDEFTAQYPAKAAMQWISLYTGSQGIYFGVHDPLPLYKELTIGQVDQRPYVRWRFPDLLLNPGEMIILPPVYLIPHIGDWRRGASIYRAWANQHIKVPDVPTWYAKKPAWAWVGLKGQHAAKPWNTLNELPRISRIVAKGGVELIQLTAYTEDGHDTLYPDYAPGPSLGGDAGLKQAVTTIHKETRKLSIYVNGRCVDPASTLRSSNRMEWAVQNMPGQPYRETYGSVTFDVMCPGAEGWRSLFIQKLAYLLKEFNIDGIYIDQVSGARSLPCYAPGHDHAKPNQAWSNYLLFMNQLLMQLKEIKPDIFLATEGVNDFFGQYFDSQQAHNDWLSPLGVKGKPLDDLFQYTFPGFVLNAGCITQEASGLHFLKIAHTHGCGYDFGIFDWREIPETFFLKSKFVLDWYARNNHVLRYGMPVDITSNSAVCQIHAFRLENKIVVNGAFAIFPPTDLQGSIHQLELFIQKDDHVKSIWFVGQEKSTRCSWMLEGNHLILTEIPCEDLFGLDIELQ